MAELLVVKSEPGAKDVEIAKQDIKLNNYISEDWVKRSVEIPSLAKYQKLFSQISVQFKTKTGRPENEKHTALFEAVIAAQPKDETIVEDQVVEAVVE